MRSSETENENNPPESLTRRAFLQAGALILTAASSVPVTAALATRAGAALDEKPDNEKKPGFDENPGPRPTLEIGLITDLHYADKPPAGTRHYRLSLEKTRKSLAEFKKTPINFLVVLGDLIDAAPDVATEMGYLKTITGVLEEFPTPRHHVLGNHCVATLTKKEFLKGVGQKKSYYSFDRGDHHFVVLDACFRKDGVPYGRNNFKWTDTDIPDEEKKWLAADLAATKKPTIVFAHQRIDMPPKHMHSIASGPQVRKILEDSKRVSAVFQGHQHINDHKLIAGIHYVTLPAIVEGPESKNAFARLEIYADRSLRIKGFGETESRKKADLPTPRVNKK